MHPEVALIQMPFSTPKTPALGLSLLKAGLARRGISSRIHYLNMWFVEQMDYGLYMRICNGYPSAAALAGEWFFAKAMGEGDPGRDQKYQQDVLLEDGIRTKLPDATLRQFFDELMENRPLIEPFFERCLANIPFDQYRIVGFTSTFQQQMASLALAKRLKERFPDLFIVFGGANCEGEMGETLFECFPFVDAVCSGEGDRVFPELVERVLRGDSPGYLPGVHSRKGAEPPSDLSDLLADRAPAAPTVMEMDTLPYPDFDDYFDQLGTVRLPSGLRPRLLFETSRGCWWGQKSHCTFCGLNGLSMTFRHKSASRALEELTWLLERYGKYTRSLSAVDNIIPMDYFRSFLPKLHDLDMELDLFYETKANLRKEQVELYSSVGLKEIQPGIESLSTPILKLMRKGVTGLQNIQLLKWCQQYGIFPVWNYLMGFPGERPEDYAGMELLIPMVSHLTPPSGWPWGIVRFDRFSPYLTNPSEFGVRNLQPVPAYRCIYPELDKGELQRIAYYFAGEFDGQDKVLEYTRALREAILTWQHQADECALFCTHMNHGTLICDLRLGAAESTIVLTGEQQAIHMACDAICSRQNLLRVLSDYNGRRAEESELDAVMADLLDRHLILSEGNQYLALAVPLGNGWAPAESARKKIASALILSREDSDTFLRTPQDFCLDKHGQVHRRSSGVASDAKGQDVPSL